MAKDGFIGTIGPKTLESGLSFCLEIIVERGLFHNERLLAQSQKAKGRESELLADAAQRELNAAGAFGDAINRLAGVDPARIATDAVYRAAAAGDVALLRGQRPEDINGDFARTVSPIAAIPEPGQQTAGDPRKSAMAQDLYVHTRAKAMDSPLSEMLRELATEFHALDQRDKMRSEHGAKVIRRRQEGKILPWPDGRS